ncbi:MAG TPA: DUF4388 domain-containing protein [Vicinamibacteria bacterium]
MPTSRWFYVQEEQRRGPVDLDVLVEMLASGQLPDGTLVWRHGLREWAPAQQVAEVADQLPPPLPAGAPAAKPPSPEEELPPPIPTAKPEPVPPEPATPEPAPADAAAEPPPDFALTAEQLRAEGKHAEAVVVCREWLAEEPDNRLARMTLGRALMAIGDFAAARAEFEIVLQASPDNLLAGRLLEECAKHLDSPSGSEVAPPPGRVETPEAHAAATRERAQASVLVSPAGEATQPEAEFWPARSLAESDVPDVLQALHETKWTGVLSLNHMGVLKTITVKDGRLVFASSNSRDDRMGELLLRRGKITLTQYIDAGRAPAEGKRVGLILVEIGALPATELVRTVVEHTQEIIYSVFQWIEGSYRLKEGLETGAEAITLKLSTADIILEGIRRIEAWSRIERGVGGMDARYERAPNYEQLLKNVSLSVDKLSLVTGQEGVRDVETICKQSTLSHFEVCRTLWAFRVIGVMRRVLAA